MRARLQFFALLAIFGHLSWFLGGVSTAPVAVSVLESGNIDNRSKYGESSGSSLEIAHGNRFVFNLVKRGEKPLAPEQTFAHASNLSTSVYHRSHLGKDPGSPPSRIQITRKQRFSKHIKREEETSGGSKDKKEKKKSGGKVEERAEAKQMVDGNKKRKPRKLNRKQMEELSNMQRGLIGSLTEADEQAINALPPHQQKEAVDQIVDEKTAKVVANFTEAEKNTILLEMPDRREEEFFLTEFPSFVTKTDKFAQKLTGPALKLRNAIWQMVQDDSFFIKHKKGRHRSTKDAHDCCNDIEKDKVCWSCDDPDSFFASDGDTLAKRR